MSTSESGPDKGYASWLASCSTLPYSEWLAAGCPSREAEQGILEANRARTEALLETLPSRDEPLRTLGAAKEAPVTPQSQANEVP